MRHIFGATLSLVDITNLNMENTPLLLRCDTLSSFERYFNSKRSYELPKGKQLIVMSEHYRDLLNLHISEDRNMLYNIEITPILFWAGLRAAKYTPNEFIQLSVNLAILSVIISLLPLAKPFVVPILNFLIFVLTLIVNFL